MRHVEASHAHVACGNHSKYHLSGLCKAYLAGTKPALHCDMTLPYRIYSTHTPYAKAASP